MIVESEMVSAAYNKWLETLSEDELKNGFRCPYCGGMMARMAV
jgi:DNA-directed RNA polymerase subunit RPC12/RpoP